MKCECTEACTTRLGTHIIYCLPGDMHDFDECPPHFVEVTRVSGMGAKVPDVPKTFGAKVKSRAIKN
jgi:hypothetical protein